MEMRIFFAVVFLFVYCESFSQTVPEYPITLLSSSFSSFVQANEIRHFDQNRIYLNSYIRKNTGLFSDVFQTKTHAGIRIKKSTVSLQFYSDKQGELISKNRFYLQTNTHVILTDKWSGFAGLSAGIVNKSLGNEQSSIQGSASVFDASARFGVYSKNHILSFAVLQIPQSNIAPINYSVMLVRYYQVYYNLLFSKIGEFQLESMLLSNVYTNYSNEYVLGLQVNWKEDYKIGCEVSSYNVINFFIDFDVLQKETYAISALAAYETNYSLSKSIRGLFNVLNGGFAIKIK